MWNILRQHLERLSTRQQEPSTKTPSSGNANPASQAVPAESQSSAANKTSTSGGASNSSAASLGGRSRFLLNRSVAPHSLCMCLRVASEFLDDVDPATQQSGSFWCDLDPAFWDIFKTTSTRKSLLEIALTVPVLFLSLPRSEAWH